MGVDLSNLLIMVLFMAGSMLTGPATKVVTELMARGAVEQDDSGVAKTAPPPAVASVPATKSTPATVIPSVAVLANAPNALPPPPPAVAPAPVAVPVQPASLPAPKPIEVAAKTADMAVPEAIPSATLLALTGDTPTRRPDGSVFLPVTVQRMIGLRTEITSVDKVSASQEIAGRIVTSRNVGALVQATQSGVIEAPDGDVPRVGTHVEKGDLLAYQRPILDAAKLAETNAKIAELKGLIEMGDQRIARLREVYLIRYRQSKIDAVEAEIANYRGQVRIYEGLLTQRVEIRAQSSGVISKVNFVSGQVVDPQTTLFEIVDPTRLWVEAAAFDPALADDISSATAVTGDGRILQLHFTGGGLMLQNQAVPLQFDIVGPVSDLQVGKPVTVIVARKHSTASGIRLPSAAILHDATGETIAWERVSAEGFRSRQVNVVPLDGKDVVVTSGLTPNMRIVTAAGEMLSQVR